MLSHYMCSRKRKINISAKGPCCIYLPEQLIFAVSIKGVWPVGISKISHSNSPHGPEGKFDQEAKSWLNISHHSQCNTALLQLSDTWKTKGTAMMSF